MATVADLEAYRDALLAALYCGSLSVQDASGRRLTYRSADELRQALSDLEARLRRTAGTGPVQQVRIKSSKGV